MTVMSRRNLVTLTVSALAVAGVGALVCIVQIYRTAQMSAGDGSGMQWIILTPLALLIVFIVIPALMTGVRGLRLLRSSEPSEPSHALPGKGWLIALGLLVVYFLAPFIVAPLLGLFLDW